MNCTWQEVIISFPPTASTIDMPAVADFQLQKGADGWFGEACRPGHIREGWGGGWACCWCSIMSNPAGLAAAHCCPLCRHSPITVLSLTFPCVRNQTVKQKNYTGTVARSAQTQWRWNVNRPSWELIIDPRRSQTEIIRSKARLLRWHMFGRTFSCKGRIAGQWIHPCSSLEKSSETS